MAGHLLRNLSAFSDTILDEADENIHCLRLLSFLVVRFHPCQKGQKLQKK